MTPEQKQTFEAVKGFIQERGFSPSFTEIGELLGGKAKSAVKRRVDGLVALGLIRTRPGRNRSIELVEHDLARVPTSALWAELERRGAAHG
jgi:SOS-response transcriptional repressor LexA